MNQEIGELLFKVIQQRLKKARAERRRASKKLNIRWKDYIEFEKIVKRGGERI